MRSLSYYTPETGEITGQLTADEQSIAVTLAADFIHCVEGFWLGTEYYVVADAVVARPQNTATISGNTLQNLPVPCKIAINGVVYDCDDQTATLELTQPIKYVIVVSAFPYLDKEFVIDYSA